MGSGAATGAIGGAASGAAMGSMVLPGWGTAIGAVVGGIAGLFSGASNDAQQENSQAWAEYNAQMGYNTQMTNIASSLAIAGINASMNSAMARMQTDSIMKTAIFNADMVNATSAYNDSLMAQDLAYMWDQEELDQELLANARARERGTIVATQAASGTVIAAGSNADVVASQMSQEALDSFIIKHGADLQAANIANARAQGAWQAEMEVTKVIWEGKVNAYNIQAGAGMSNAAGLASANISAYAGRRSAENALLSGQSGIAQADAAYSLGNNQVMVQGLFSAAGTGVKAYYANKVPSTNTFGTGGYSSLAIGGRTTPGMAYAKPGSYTSLAF